ncbi:carbohydrate kinase [Echinicola marina]|uniref:carbohydrate kinase family protein n=1 Tax=Echinicola marina TaxID=2859768 RepID=UPI001CF6E8E0|nr:carbohydrate kinase [Echinicola marina]UCS93108.1 carbohydrate kinase [Echinicola marina]
MHKKIVIFGEMLWDCFSDRSIPGGAPMNVALHTQYLGLETSFISKVGNDNWGKELLDFVQDKSLNTDLIQVDEHYDTSRVLVDDADKENIKYEIVEAVAWDFIQWSKEMQKKVNEADAFIFGSLSARNEDSRNTLFKLLETSVLKIFDINLRAPYFEASLLEKLLKKADILKINDDELLLLMDIFKLDKNGDKALERLSEDFGLQMICVTKGAAGAIIYDGKKSHSHPGYKVKVADTVGSGDAFLSGFIYKSLSGDSPKEILDFACALGALVATNKGGTPQYELEDIASIQRT